MFQNVMEAAESKVALALKDKIVIRNGFEYVCEKSGKQGLFPALSRPH